MSKDEISEKVSFYVSEFGKGNLEPIRELITGFKNMDEEAEKLLEKTLDELNFQPKILDLFYDENVFPYELITPSMIKTFSDEISLNSLNMILLEGPEELKGFFALHYPEKIERLRKYYEENFPRDIDKISLSDLDIDINEDFVFKKPQLDNIKKTVNILSNSRTCFDVSMMGKGKTSCAIESARRLGYKIWVICPKNLLDTWKEEAKKLKYYGIIEVINYDSIVAMNTNTGGPFFEGDIQSEYKVSSRTKSNLVKNSGKVLVICDEFHKLKNYTTKVSQVMYTIVDYAKFKNSGTKFLFLGGTPGEFQTNSFSFLRLIGTTTERTPSERALNETIESVRKTFGNTELVELLDSYASNTIPARVKIFHRIFTLLYCKFLITEISGENLFDQGCVYDYYVPLAGDELNTYKDAVSSFNEALLVLGQHHQQQIFAAMVELESSKIQAMIRTGLHILKTIPNSKIVFFPSYVETGLKVIFETLKDMVNKGELEENCFPLLFSGSIKPDEKISNVKEFQKPNLDNRIIIVTTESGGAGLNLGDTDGEFPRYVIHSGCSNKYISIKQSLFRTIRASSKSYSYVLMVKCYEVGREKNFEEMNEEKLIKSHFEKDKDMSDITGRKERNEYVRSNMVVDEDFAIILDEKPSVEKGLRKDFEIYFDEIVEKKKKEIYDRINGVNMLKKISDDALKTLKNEKTK